MPGLLRRLFSESAVYGLGGMANQAVAILLVPIYARELGVASFGIVAVLTTTLSLTNMVVGLAMPQGFFRSYLKEAHDERERHAVLGATLSLRLAISTVLIASYMLAAIPLAQVLSDDVDLLPLLWMVGVISFFDTLNILPMSFLRAQRRPRPYAMLAFGRALIGSGLIVLFVVFFGLGVAGVVLGSAISAAAVAAAGYIFLVRRARARPRWNTAFSRHMLAFCLPLVPAAAAGWTLNLSDRYLIQAFIGAAAVGTYAAGYAIGMVLNALAVQPFSLAWGAAYWDLAKQERARESIARVLTAFVVFASFMGLILGALGTDIVRIFLTDEFEAARFVVPFSTFGFVLYGCWTVATTGLNLESQTRWIPLAVGTAAVAAVVANVLLIPLLGFMAAAYVTLASYALLALMGGLLSQRYYPVPWRLGAVVVTMVIGLGLALAAVHGPDSILWRLGCVAIYPIMVVGLRIIRPAELAALRGMLLRR
jgi:O-antigen/teichoic acid export membrane protein